MNGILYGIIQEMYVLGTENRISYGIAAYADPETSGTASVITAVRDICDNKDKIDALVLPCNTHRLSPIHLQDIIEDFLGEYQADTYRN